MAYPIRYIHPRGTQLYYERRVPLDIVRQSDMWAMYFNSQPLYRRSLHTRDQASALSAAKIEGRKFESLVTLARGGRTTGGSTNVAPMAPKQAVTVHLLDQIRLSTRETTVRPWVQAMINAELSDELADELARMRADREWNAEIVHEILFEPGTASKDPRFSTPSEIALDLIEYDNINAPIGSGERGLIVSAVRSGMIDGQRAIDDILDGRTSAINAMARSPKRASILLSQAVDTYLKNKITNLRTADAVRAALRNFISVVGDRSLDDLDRADFQKFLETSAKKTVGGRSPGSVARPVSIQTIQKDMRLIGSAIKFAKDRGLFAGENPAHGHNLSAWVSSADKSVMPDKRPFTVTELNKILRHPWFIGCHSLERPLLEGSYRLKGAHYWVPIIAMFTGCRASELGGLKVSEVMLDDIYPHIKIRDNEYRPTKGAYARSIPILDALMELGFGNYVEAIKLSGADRIFPDWIPARKVSKGASMDAAWSNGAVIRSFNRNVIRKMLGAEMIPGARLEVTFHSFRGAFQSMLGLARYALPTNFIHEVIGHAKIALDKRYVGVIPLEETYPAISKCNFSGLIIPPPPPMPS